MSLLTDKMAEVFTYFSSIYLLGGGGGGLLPLLVFNLELQLELQPDNMVLLMVLT